ncbi:uncharacterized protein LOC108736790 isoform X2 [Agrilus planipennis]|uniref:Uncharacterized protein LOC108736790 isoform X2 n=1 Tax=Agrilus planipennis TaxID=224129 RepID=A0A7F5RK40_AGRPL|nr:uncharacterized protein LOC108736790 isoform X2 [Agrilus planipennis]
MEPNANTSKDQNLDSGNSGNTVTSQVLEYFNNFSQSENLSRYFRGSKTKKTHSFEDIAVADCSRPQFIGENQFETEEVGLDINKPGNENKEISPTSSLASNRKLEWDNGADIGYKNVQILQKSLSLPVLNSAGKVNIHEELLRLSPEGINCSTEQERRPPAMSRFPLNVQNSQGLVMLPESSGDESPVEHKNKIIPSSSSSSLKVDDIHPHLHDLSSSDDDAPIAVSTPFDKDSYGETCASKLKKQKNGSLEYKNEYTQMSRKDKDKGRTFKLQISKPIYVDCFNKEEISYSNKNIQTSFKDLSSKLVQTDAFLSQMYPKKNKISEKHEGTHSEHELDIKENPSSSYPSRPNSASSLSKCESFQYLNAEEYHPNQEDNIENMMEEKSAPTYNFPSGSKTEQVNRLQTNICSKSGEPTGKVNKGINLIKKLIKSQKYDSTTKRQYINMIIKKIIEQNCSDESTEGFSSPKFDLNKSNFDLAPPTNSTSDLSDPPKENSTKIISNTNHKRATKRNLLHQNKPWIPIVRSPNRNLDYKESLNFQTFSNEIVAPVEQEKQVFYQKTELPCTDQKISSAYDKLKKSHYTMVSDEVQKSKCVKGKGDDNHHSISNLHQKYKFPEKYRERNWNQDKTQAEKMSSRCPDSSDSYNDSETVTRFAKNEKLHQLNWIKCEIAYLSKLKNLLESTNGYLSSSCVDSNEVKDTNSNSSTLMKNAEDGKKANVDNFEVLTTVDVKPLQKGVTQKTNTIYLITTERLKDSATGKLPQSKLITEEELLNSNDKDLKVLNNVIRKLTIDNKSEIEQSPEAECNELSKKLTEVNSESLPFDIQKAKLISTTVHTIVNNNSQKTLIKRYTFEVSEESTSAHKDYDKTSTSNTSSSNKHTAENDSRSHTVDAQSTSSSTKPSNMNKVALTNNTNFIKKDLHEKNEDATTRKTNFVYKTNQSSTPHLCKLNGENQIILANGNKNTTQGKIQSNTITESSSENNKTQSDFQKKIIHLQKTIDQKEQELKEIKSLLNRNTLNIHNNVPEKLKDKNNSSKNADQNYKISEVPVRNEQKEEAKKLPRKGSAESTKHISKSINNANNEENTYSEHHLTNDKKLNKNFPLDALSISSQSDYPEQEISEEVTSIKSSYDSKTPYVSSEDKSRENDKCYYQKQEKQSQSDRTSKTICCCKDDQNVMFEIKDVVTKLNRLIEEENECCKCLYDHKNQSKSNSNVTNKHKLPIAYTLILEERELNRNVENNKNSGKNKKTRPLQEIRIKFPLPHSKKKSKKARYSNHRKRKESSFVDLPTHENETAEYEYDDNNVPLYEYLNKNRPQFVQSAEERRKCIYELAIIREQCRRKYKELLALTDGIPLASSINRNDSKIKRSSPKWRN